MRSSRSIFSLGCLVLGLIAITAAPGSASLVGLWEFEDAGNLATATIGADLALTGSDAAVAGSGGADTGATQVGVASHYTVTHGIAPSGGAKVNQYSLLLDINYPTAGIWRTLYSTDTDISASDGEYFIHPADESWGVADLGYTDNGTTGEFYSSADTWYRAVLTLDLGNAINLYIDGNLTGVHDASSIDSRFGLESVFHLLGDNDGDDGLINVSNFAVYDSVLSPQEVSALGGAGLAIPEPGTMALLVVAAGLLAFRRRR